MLFGNIWSGWFLIKISIFESPAGCNSEEFITWKLQLKNINFLKSEKSNEMKYFIIEISKTFNNNSIK